MSDVGLADQRIQPARHKGRLLEGEHLRRRSAPHGGARKSVEQGGAATQRCGDSRARATDCAREERKGTRDVGICRSTPQVKHNTLRERRCDHASDPNARRSHAAHMLLARRRRHMTFGPALTRGSRVDHTTLTCKSHAAGVTCLPRAADVSLTAPLTMLRASKLHVVLILVSDF